MLLGVIIIVGVLTSKELMLENSLEGTLGVAKFCPLSSLSPPCRPPRSSISSSGDGAGILLSFSSLIAEVVLFVLLKLLEISSASSSSHSSSVMSNGPKTKIEEFFHVTSPEIVLEKTFPCEFSSADYIVS